MAQAHFGVRHVIGAPLSRRLPEQALIALPPRAAKFTLAEWKLTNYHQCRNTEDQQHLADRILAECNRVREETNERALTMHDTTKLRLEERISDVSFNKKELEIVRKDVCLELEALSVYKVRVQDCLASLDDNGLNIVRKCLMLRDGRLGIDLVIDDVENALKEEIELILGGKTLLKKLLEQLQEQMRRLRSARYMIDHDLQYKEDAINIDKGNLTLKVTDLSLSVYEGYSNLDPSNISTEEYNSYSAKIVRDAAREVANTRPIRTYVDALLKEVIGDLVTAYNKTNHEFEERIKVTRLVKSRLEDMHHETSKKIDDIQQTILLLQKALVDKECRAGLAQTRLGRRAQRFGAELVRDSVGQSLLHECELNRYSVLQLQQMLHEVTASLRYLNQTQLQLQEDINVKMNTLKIDEVDCMTLRATMNYHPY